jgi:tripartite-type tricarboxylate transporter receptor subunit TctC
VHVPYKGGGPAMMDTIAGQAQVNMASLIQVGPHVKSGKLRLLATSGTRRSAIFPDTPTVAETVPGYDATNWWGLVAPAGTPAPILGRIFSELETILKSDQTKKRVENEGAEVIRMSSAEFGRFIADETQKWAKVVKQAGIAAE